MIKNQFDLKGLPTSVLGKTGVIIPRIAIGMGSRFLNIPTLEEALEMCNYALDNGLYYWDTAYDYVNNSTGAISEERLGHLSKTGVMRFSFLQKYLPAILKKPNAKLKRA